uniref:Uncharacterized protein n=1 Tax=Florenciella parvula TaxID=236787 RepID=A0A7S2C327_9STRA
MLLVLVLVLVLLCVALLVYWLQVVEQRLERLRVLLYSSLLKLRMLHLLHLLHLLLPLQVLRLYLLMLLLLLLLLLQKPLLVQVLCAAIRTRALIMLMVRVERLVLGC